MEAECSGNTHHKVSREDGASNSSPIPPRGVWGHLHRAEAEQKFSWQRREVSEIAGRGGSMRKRKEAQKSIVCSVADGGRTDRRWAGPVGGTWMPLEACGSALGEIWTSRDRSARCNTGGWLQMSLQ